MNLKLIAESLRQIADTLESDLPNPGQATLNFETVEVITEPPKAEAIRKQAESLTEPEPAFSAFEFPGAGEEAPKSVPAATPDDVKAAFQALSTKIGATQANATVVEALKAAGADRLGTATPEQVTKVYSILQEKLHG
jgi:hypothetical protein